MASTSEPTRVAPSRVAGLWAGDSFRQAGTFRRLSFHMGSEPIGGMSMRTVLGVLVSALLVIGCSGSTPSAAPAAASAAGSSAGQNGAFGGTVKFNDAGATTTAVEGVADGTSVSGTAVTQAAGKTHNVTL